MPDLDNEILKAGIDRLSGETTILSLKERAVIGAVALVNSLVIAAGISSVLPNSRIHINFLAMFVSDWTRQVIKDSAPYLFLDARKRARITEILRIAGGSIRRVNAKEVTIGKSVTLEPNYIADLIESAPVIGKTLIGFISRILIITALTDGSVHNRSKDIEIIKPPIIERKESRCTIHYKGYPHLYLKGEVGEPLLMPNEDKPLRLEYKEE